MFGTQNQSKLKTFSVVIGGFILLASSVVFLGSFDLVLFILLGICFVVYFIHRHTVPPLILVNLILINATSLLFALGLGFGITEDYHPNSVARPLFPTVGVLFLISVFSLITSLMAWFQWRRVTGRVVGVVLVSFILVLGIAGSITYSLTETNREVYTIEHRGLTYEIPRVYNPGYWNDLSAHQSERLKIEVCDEKPSAPVYDDNPFGNRDFPCTGVPYRITPSEDVLRAPHSFGWVGEGKSGFALATSSQGLVLTEYDEAVAADNFLQRENAIDKTVIQSVPIESANVSAEYDTVIYMEVVNDLVKWLTICRGYESCTSYEPLPDDPQYVIRTTTENAVFKHTGTVENMVWKYKEESKDALALFESFKVKNSNNLTDPKQNGFSNKSSSTVDSPLQPLADKSPIQRDVWLKTTKNNITFIDSPVATSSPAQFVADSNGDYTNVEVVSVQMDNEYTFMTYRKIDNDKDVRQGVFLVPALTQGTRYMLLVDLAERRAEALFRIDDIIDKDTRVATFDINEDRSIVRITTPSKFDRGNYPVPGTSVTILIDLKNQTYRDIGDPITYQWTDTGYEYKYINDEECLQNSGSLEPIADPRCDRLINRTPWITYVQS